MLIMRDSIPAQEAEEKEETRHKMTNLLLRGLQYALMAALVVAVVMMLLRNFVLPIASAAVSLLSSGWGLLIAALLIILVWWLYNVGKHHRSADRED
jgi:uncharacterized membrane protein